MTDVRLCERYGVPGCKETCEGDWVFCQEHRYSQVGRTDEEVLAEERAKAREQGRREGLEEAAKAAMVFQDIVGWQSGETRNRLIVDIAEAIRKLLEKSGGAK